MGSLSSKSTEDSKVDNKGLLNGNKISVTNIAEKVNDIEKLIYYVIIVKTDETEALG